MCHHHIIISYMLNNKSTNTTNNTNHSNSTSFNTNTWNIVVLVGYPQVYVFMLSSFDDMTILFMHVLIMICIQNKIKKNIIQLFEEILSLVLCTRKFWNILGLHTKRKWLKLVVFMVVIMNMKYLLVSVCLLFILCVCCVCVWCICLKYILFIHFLMCNCWFF